MTTTTTQIAKAVATRSAGSFVVAVAAAAVVVNIGDESRGDDGGELTFGKRVFMINALVGKEMFLFTLYSLSSFSLFLSFSNVEYYETYRGREEEK